jgi:RimJ/RimL family protein N-acetyltransferase
MVDADVAYRRWARDIEVTRYLSWPTHESVDDTRGFFSTLAGAWERSEAYVWVICERGEDSRADPSALGTVALRPLDHGWDTGYVLAREVWGQGVATEALDALTRWVAEEARIHRFWAVCHPDNPASARVLEKVGMRFEGTLRRWMVFPNLGPEPRDVDAWARVW